MTPFLQLRLWWRLASQSSRLASSLSVAIVVGLLAYLLVPTTGDDENALSSVETGPGVVEDGGAGVGAAGDASGSVDAGIAPGSAATPGADAGAAPSSGTDQNSGVAASPVASAPASGGGKACASAPSGTPGVTDKTVTVSVVLLALAGPVGNTAVGIASPDELRRIAEVVKDDINARGGLQCRRLELKYYEVNPLSQDQQRSACLQIAQDRPLMVVDIAGYAFPAGSYACIPQQKIPLVASQPLLLSEIQRFRPYLATPAADVETLLRTAVFALRDRKWFDSSNGFKKLGVVYDDCSPEANRIFDARLADVGITGGQISKYTYSCPTTGFHPPNAVNQAVTQHRLAGVTHVIPLSASSFDMYTDLAQNQGFKPKYAIHDYGGLISVFSGSTKPNADNFDRTIAITTNTYGQSETSGLKPDPGTTRCLALVRKAGLGPEYVYGQKLGGLVCTFLWMAEAAIGHARTITREEVLPGLFNAGVVQMAYPSPDSTYRPPLKFSGGDTWWPIEYQRECECFRVIDSNRRPSYRA